jgi:hypothetical protein
MHVNSETKATCDYRRLIFSVVLAPQSAPKNGILSRAVKPTPFSSMMRKSARNSAAMRHEQRQKLIPIASAVKMTRL